MTKTNDQEAEEVLDIVEAAIKWWEAKCPYDHTQREHLSDPTANCVNHVEEQLAKTVAKYLSTH